MTLDQFVKAAIDAADLFWLYNCRLKDAVLMARLMDDMIEQLRAATFIECRQDASIAAATIAEWQDHVENAFNLRVAYLSHLAHSHGVEA